MAAAGTPITDVDRRHLSRCVELAEEALSAGDEPFGSVLVDGNGTALAEGRNRVVETGDATQHPEIELARWAAAHLTPEQRAQCTVYTSGEHCPMCAAAHGWVGLGRVVYATSAQQLTAWLAQTGSAPAPVSPLPIADVAPRVVVVGPVDEFVEDVRRLQLRSAGSDSTAVPAGQRYPKKTVEVDGVPIAYVEVGEGRPVVLLHGNPTSSYLWRNVLPHLERSGRCLAPDLVGMGDSGRLPDSGPGRYSFDTHSRYLAGFLEQVGADSDVVLVLHDWGSGLGFDWARQHPDAVRGIAYMEAIVAPFPSWDVWPQAARRVFQAMRSPAGEDLVLQRNTFVERILPASVLRGLTEAEMEVYRRPYLEPGESRRPTLDWPRELPFRDEGPAEVVERVQAYADWLAQAPVPKLFVDADPGSILVGPQRELALSWPQQTVVRVPGSHFLQEDSPDEIGAALAAWIGDLR